MLDFENDEQLQSHEVRLFPTIRISSVREAELRATAGLLAMVKAVSAFGRSVVRTAGGPAGRLSTYSEVTFKPVGPEDKELRPDGIIRSVRGKRDWKAMVEVKVGDSPLDQRQIDDYHRLAKQEGFDVLITISNQAARHDGRPPLHLDGRRLRSVPVVHFSWDRLLSEARMLSQKKGVEDPDQQWMLDEWIKYVADRESKIIEPPQLGAHWAEILKAARESSLLSVAKYLDELVRCWDGYLKKEALRLRAKLGVEVHPKISRRERGEPAIRVKRLKDRVLENGRIGGEIRIPDAAGDIEVEMVLAARAVRLCLELTAPTKGRQQTRINWLVKQLKGQQVPPELVVKVDWDKKGLISQAKAGQVVEDLSCLLRDGHNQPIPREAVPKRFLLEWTRPLQKGRGKSTARVLEGVSTDLEAFYGGVVERMTAFVPPAPKLPEERPLTEAPSVLLPQLEPDVVGPEVPTGPDLLSPRVDWQGH